MKLGFRASTFLHSLDTDANQATFSAVYQDYEVSETGEKSVGIYYEEFTLDGEAGLTGSGPTLLIKGGTKPVARYQRTFDSETGEDGNIIVLIAYEAKASEGSGNRVYVAQFNDAKSGGEPDHTIEFPASFNSLNEGSPSFNNLVFKGDI